MITFRQAKAILKTRGWSQRRAAAALHVTQTHLSLVLNGRRTSRSLLIRIDALPRSDIPYRHIGFALRRVS